MKGGIAAMRHRVLLCTQKDIVTEGTTDWKIIREGVLPMWAKIEEKAASTFTNRGATTDEARTHIIMTRYRSDLNVSNMAWIYEERLKSSPRWFKILKVGQTETKGQPYYKFEVRLIERDDRVAAPVEQDSTVRPMPHGVNL